MSSLIVKPFSNPIPERRYRPRREVGRPLPINHPKDDRNQITADALLRDRYRIAFEPGCATGALTARLATRCDRVIARDPSAVAVASAQRRCRPFQNVEISQGGIATHLPVEELDLIVLNDAGYHYSGPQLRELARQLASCMGENAEFVAVHGLGWSTGRRLTADQIHAVLGDELPLLSVKRIRYPTFRLDIWVRA